MEGGAPTLCARVRRLAAKYNLMLAFAVAITVGLVWPAPGVALGAEVEGVQPFTVACVILIFLLNGLKLKTRDVRAALQDWPALAFGAASILFLTVVAAVGALRAMRSAGGLPDSALTTGMIVFFSTPTTINMGTVITEQAGGSVPMALLLTIACNLAGVFTVPPLLGWIGDLSGAGGLDAGALVVKLLYSVFAPCVVGHAVRQRVAAVREFVDAHGFPLKIVSSIALACIPWVSISKANESGALRGTSAGDVFTVAGWFAAVHLVLVAMNVLGCWLLRLQPASFKSVVVMASQKTFPVAATIINFLPQAVGDPGLMLVAAIICQQVLPAAPSAPPPRRPPPWQTQLLLDSVGAATLLGRLDGPPHPPDANTAPVSGRQVASV